MREEISREQVLMIWISCSCLWLECVGRILLLWFWGLSNAFERMLVIHNILYVLPLSGLHIYNITNGFAQDPEEMDYSVDQERRIQLVKVSSYCFDFESLMFSQIGLRELYS